MAMADVAQSRPAKRKKLRSASTTESTQSNDDLINDNNNNNNSITLIISDLQDGYRAAINNPPSRREKMDTAARGSPGNKAPAAEKIPAAAEIEEFFAAAEKNIQKLFKDKYNFDVAKDVPLEGRYEWVQIKP